MGGMAIELGYCKCNDQSMNQSINGPDPKGTFWKYLVEMERVHVDNAAKRA
jgi:hypothetical protein